ncbi:MAG: GGDEF domain-containing protein [Atopobiaceae bacterium]|nr:GGDEF domain-containing protein [Atopobiaceae bacterium]
MACFISACFLVVHVIMIATFWRCGVTPMVYFNVGSIIFYVLSFELIRQERLGLYTDLVYVEVVAHMTCAVLLTGWNSDFQIAVVGMSAFAFFAEYLERYLNIRHAHALHLCVLGAFAYLGSCAVSALRPAPYALPGTVSFFLRLTWGAIVFGVSTMVLQAFVREATRSEKALTNRLMHDKLTGLPNRYYITEYLDKLSKSGDLNKYWVALADIDDFKHVNDTYGHNCGDFVLETIAHLLQEGVGDAQVCRWGGEEFLVVGRIGEGMESQRELLDRTRRTIEGQSLWYEEHRVNVTITLGVAAYREGYTRSEWINVADERLYEGKKSGKNQVVM